MFGFVRVEGSVAIEKRTETVTLAKKTGQTTGDRVEVDLLALGGSSVDIFAGVGAGTSDAIGLLLDDVAFGLALMTSRADTSRRWTALSAQATSVGFVGLSDLLPTVRNLAVELNQATRANDVVVDFSAQALQVATGGASPVTLGFSGAQGELLRAQGDVTLQLSEFVYLSGRIGFERYTPTGHHAQRRQQGLGHLDDGHHRA